MISFVNHSKFLALHQIFEERKNTSEKERMKEENQKKKKNRKHNEQAPPPYIIALGHALLSKKCALAAAVAARAPAKI